MGVYFVFILSICLVDGVVGDTSGLKLVSVMEGDSVSLNTDITKQQQDKILWYFNNTLIAQINGESSKSCLYDGEGGRFRNRLEVDYKTGSLTVANVKPEHSGHYEAELIQSKSSGTSENLKRKSKCNSTKVIRKMSNIGDTIKTFIVSISASLSGPDKSKKEPYKMEKESEQKSASDSGLSSAVVAGMCVVGVVLLVAAAAAAVGVIYYRCRHSSNDMEKNKLEHLLKVQA